MQSPVCVPSRISFFTGRYAHSHRNRVNYTPLELIGSAHASPSPRGGYQTAAVGKLHYYPPTKEEALRTGFDAVELHDGVPFTDAWSDYARWRNAHDPLNYLPYRSVAKAIASGKNPFRSTSPPSSPTSLGSASVRANIAAAGRQQQAFLSLCLVLETARAIRSRGAVRLRCTIASNSRCRGARRWPTWSDFPAAGEARAARRPEDPGHAGGALAWMYRSYFGTIDSRSGK